LATRGIDLFIGDPKMIERGHGSALIRCFVDTLLQNGTPRVVTDPDPANGRALRAYENAGFEKDRMVETPDGPAVLMVRSA
jgi:aminoglycoside 6'-N-acetyltransferase